MSLNLDELVAEFFSAGGVTQECEQGKKSFLSSQAMLVGIDSSNNDWAKGGSFVLTFRVNRGAGDDIKILSSASWVDDLIKGGIYNIDYKVRPNDRMFPVAPYAFCGKKIPTLLDHSTNLSCGQKSRSTPGSASCRPYR